MPAQKPLGQVSLILQAWHQNIELHGKPARSPEHPFVAGAPPERVEPVVGEMVEVLNPYTTIFYNFRPEIYINALIQSPNELKIKDFLKRPRCRTESEFDRG